MHLIVLMAKADYHSCHLILSMILLLIHHSNQRQPSQSQTLLKIQQLLYYPSALSSLNNSTDLCNSEPTPSLTLVCYENNMTQLHIIGNNGVPPLPKNFSIYTFFDTLVGLSSLKVLSLVSLGLWGPLPSSIGYLSSLEILNVSSNYLTGTIPVQLSPLRSLQTLILDHNKFTGRVPDWLSSLPALDVLSLRNNLLSGSLPNSLSGLENIRILALSMNHLSGEVPDLHNLTNLQVLDLEDNYFGPHFPILNSKLVILVLRKNRFHLGIPADLGSYYQLQKFDVSLNGFVGPFLAQLLSLPSITYVDVAGNRFTGMLSQNMSCNGELAFANLSSNLLTGDLPTCLQSNSNSTVVLYSWNCLLNGDQEQHPSYFCQNEALAVKISPNKQKHKRPFAKAVLALSIVGGIVGGIVLVGLVFLCTRRVHTKNTVKTPQTKSIPENVSAVNTVKLLTDARYISKTKRLGVLGLPAYRTFSLEELKEATNDFDASSFLGDGSHGQIYKGKLTDGTLVAIRSLKMRKRHSPQTYTHHIELISKLRHSHLVSALGHCFECYLDDSSVNKVYLVFEFVPNGTLRGCISAIEYFLLTNSLAEALPGQKLTWTQRIAAVIGVAKGIQFLHMGIVPGVFSNNVKITNVLFDHDFRVKINSYNLPLLAENSNTVGAGVSSPGPKEIVRTRAKHEEKNDVYDIGVIFLEVIVGRPIMSQNEIIVIKDLLKVSIAIDDTARRSIVDPAVHKECSDESLRTMMEICLRCLCNEPTDRPSVEDVLWNLQYAAQVQVSRKGNAHNNQNPPA